MSVQLAKIAAGLLAGVVFGLGLSVAGLANPDKVLQFLTLNSNWSPALLFAMAAGIAVTFVGYKIVLRRGPVFDDTLHMPTKTQLDPRLLIGAVIFGIGWGTAGFCPGPAIVGLSSGLPEPLIFIAAMIVGSQLQRLTVKS